MLPFIPALLAIAGAIAKAASSMPPRWTQMGKCPKCGANMRLNRIVTKMSPNDDKYFTGAWFGRCPECGNNLTDNSGFLYR